MPIITISRGSYYKGKQVAEKVAENLGWECFSRDSLIDGSELFHDSEFKLVRNILDATTILDRFPYGKERYVQVIRAALLDFFSKDNVVYHGLAGRHFLGDISHQLKVRIIADIETRVAEEMERENISADEARLTLKKDDEERRKWSLYLHGVDTWDPKHYDLVINIGSLTVDDAVDIIRNTALLPRFQATGESLAKARDMALEARAKAELFQYPNAVVFARDGKVAVELKAPDEQKEDIVAIVEAAIGKLNDVEGVEVCVVPYF